MMKKHDRILIGALLLICITVAAFLSTRSDAQPRHAVITQNGVVLYDIPLTGHRGTEEIFLKDGDGTNIIRIEDETIAVTAADCPDQICVKTSAASQKGDIIACLPHKLLIEVK